MGRLLLFVLVLCGAARPAKNLSLDYLLIDVNGESRILAANQELMVVAGDQLSLQKGFGTDGVELRSLYLKAEDQITIPIWRLGRRGRLDSSQAWALAAVPKLGGLRLVFTAYQGGRKLGQIILHMKRPELHYAVCSINGIDRVVRPGQLLKLRKADLFKLKEVASNVEALSQEVGFEIAPVGGFKEIPSLEFYEMRFRRGDYVFARIPLEIEAP